MKKIELGQKIQILANVGVLAGIVFVAYEIRQSNRIAMGTTSYELSRNWMDINELYLTNADVLDLIVDMADENFLPKNERQMQQSLAYARRVLNNWIAIEEAYDNGIASNAFYTLAVADVKAIIGNRPGVIPMFEILASQYDLSVYPLLEPILQAIEERRASDEES